MADSAAMSMCEATGLGFSCQLQNRRCFADAIG
jgi:hypothetical protein